MMVLLVKNLFQLYGVESQTPQFQLVMCVLEVAHLRKIESVIVTPTLVNPYDVIRISFDTFEDEN